MKQDNRINRWFFKKQVEEERNQYDKYKIMKGFYNEIHGSIELAKGLVKLMDIHKMMWKLGFRNGNLAPCEHGMFRTKNIETMTEDEVFLGNIWGIFTNTVSFWNKHSDEKILCNGFGISPDTKVYDLIVSQYKTLLRTNIESIEEQVEKYINDYEELNPPEDPFSIL